MNDGLKKSETVLVAVTGKMDSAVAAFLLKKQGYNVIALAIVTCDKTLASSNLPKCHIQDLDKVKALCKQMGVQFYATDVKSQFESEVVDPLISNRLSARANTSCFRCTNLKLLTLYEKMIQLKADFIATGHYAKLLKNINTGRFYIHSNNDLKSDQSFVLAGLPDDILEKLILPLGELRKDDVVKLVNRFNLPVAIKPDSEKIFCFTDKNMVNELVKKRVPKSLLREGQVYNAITNSFCGDHKGMGFHYISEKNLHFTNTGANLNDLEIVKYNFPQAMIEIGPAKLLSYEASEVVRLKLSKGIDASGPINCFFKFKHVTDFNKCTLFIKNSNNAFVEFEESVYPMIPHETIIFYENNSRNAKIIGIGHVGKPGTFELCDRVSDFKRKEDEVIDELEAKRNKDKKANQVFKF